MEHTLKIKDKKVYDSLIVFLKTLGINLSGEKVQHQISTTKKYPLSGTLLKYDNPFGSATNISDWETIK